MMRAAIRNTSRRHKTRIGTAARDLIAAIGGSIPEKGIAVLGSDYEIIIRKLQERGQEIEYIWFDDAIHLPESLAGEV